jgi:hypothetical protein
MVDHIFVVVLAAGWLTIRLVHRVQETMGCGRVKRFKDLVQKHDGMLRRKSNFVLGAWEMTTKGDCAQDRRYVTSIVVRGIIITCCMTRHQ